MSSWKEFRMSADGTSRRPASEGRRGFWGEADSRNSSAGHTYEFTPPTAPEHPLPAVTQGNWVEPFEMARAVPSGWE